ncbi:hypothetical protein Q8A73_001139 [Channa argus]|nr:hypothetical protein Q8A73_001139 [Channa argus]
MRNYSLPLRDNAEVVQTCSWTDLAKPLAPRHLIECLVCHISGADVADFLSFPPSASLLSSVDRGRFLLPLLHVPPERLNSSRRCARICTEPTGKLKLPTPLLNQSKKYLLQSATSAKQWSCAGLPVGQEARATA